MASLLEASCFSLRLVTELDRDFNKVRAARCPVLHQVLLAPTKDPKQPLTTWAKHRVSFAQRGDTGVEPLRRCLRAGEPAIGPDNGPATMSKPTPFLQARRLTQRQNIYSHNHFHCNC